MQLFYSEASPYARKVRVMLLELGLEAELTDCNPLQAGKDYLELNPLGKVPCLMTDQGALFDSDVIVDYLISLKLDKDPSDLNIQSNDWSKKVLYSAASGLLDIAVDRRKELALRNENERSKFWLARFDDGILRTVTWMEKSLTEQASSWQSISVAELTTAIALEYLDFRHPELGWRSHARNLGNWLEEIKDRASLEATRPV